MKTIELNIKNTIYVKFSINNIFKYRKLRSIFNKYYNEIYLFNVRTIIVDEILIPIKIIIASICWREFYGNTYYSNNLNPETEYNISYKIVGHWYNINNNFVFGPSCNMFILFNKYEPKKDWLTGWRKI